MYGVLAVGIVAAVAMGAGLVGDQLNIVFATKQLAVPVACK